MKHIFIIGSKGIPAQYGGFESFVDRLTEYKQNPQIQYHIACMNTEKEVWHHEARCFGIKVPSIGPAKAVYYDIQAMKSCIQYIEEHHIRDAIVYILACRIGPFTHYFKKKLNKLGCGLYINPDGHEWMRAKWNYFIKKYWKLSEKLMVKYADYIVCDSKNIQEYILKTYSTYQPASGYIAYGSDLSPSPIQNMDEGFQQWLAKQHAKPYEYYLIVGRFVPENNYQTIIKEYMKSDTTKKLLVITNVEHNKYYSQLKKETGYEKDQRIVFAGTVYDQDLLKKIREQAYGYLHGHEVGGTNPSLLEALASTKINLLLDVGFNREVAEDAAYYWDKEAGSKI